MQPEQKLKLINPTTGENFRELTYHTMRESEYRLLLASKAQKEWIQTTIYQRISVIESAMNYFRDNIDIISREITLQMGKPIFQSKNEIYLELINLYIVNIYKNDTI